jgi:ADP-ribose pyrophosphatase YjhB (NUDIX family)
MLVVQEKSGPAAARRLWKMPTGLADPGEDITDAVIREVREETGLDCVFDHIICFRQAHYPRKSDMFFVCQLKLAEKYDQELQQGKEIKLFPQEQEIAEAKWVDVEEYFSQPLWLSSPLYMKMNEALTEAAERITDESKKSGFIGKRLPIGFNPGHNTIYFMGSNKGSNNEDTP